MDKKKVLVIGVIGADVHAVGNKILNIAEPVFLASLLVVMTAFLVDGSFNPFLYFRF